MTDDEIQQAAAEAAEAFVEATPNYYPCRDNFEALAYFMVKHEMEPTFENFQDAYQALNGIGMLVKRSEAARFASKRTEDDFENLTMKDVDRMKSDEYKKKLAIPAFVKKVESLLAGQQ